MDIQGKQALQKLINEMHDVTGMWSVEQMVTHVWQAAKAHETKKLEGCVVVPTTPSYEMWSGIARDLGRYMQMHDRYCPKTLKKYFDRFIGDIPEWLNKEVKDWNSDHAFATADLPAFIYMSMLEAARSQS